jgi:subtilase family serine protease
MKLPLFVRFLTAGIGGVVIGGLLIGAWAPIGNQRAAAATSSAVAAVNHPFSVRLNLSNAKPPKVSRSGVVQPQASPNPALFYETPSSLACVYGLITQTAGCSPATATAIVPNAASPLSIAIVIAYHNPTIQSDLTTFDSQFGLPAPPSFQVVYASGSQPATDSGWAQESSIDVEWSHAMSPNAKLYLVEAASNYDSDLYAAVTVAGNLVAADGGGIVSMSWGRAEFSTETSLDSHFQKSGVTYIASSGDAPGVSYPNSSAYVISAGGTTISRSPSNGQFVGEGTWQQTGGGSSAYIPRPSYQNLISPLIGSKRSVPDIAAVADPQTGVWVYSATGSGGWGVWGGTSVAAPVLAGIMSHTGTKFTGILGALNSIYGGTFGNFRDITTGNCGPYAGYTAGVSWDFCTGRGSLLGGYRMLAVSGGITH